MMKRFLFAVAFLALSTPAFAQQCVPSVVAGCVFQQTGTSYTVALKDCGTTIEFTSGSAIAVTLPNNLPIGCSVSAVQKGAGQITFSAASGATLVNAHSFTKTFGQSAGVALSVIENAGGGSALWFLFGDGA